MWGQCHGQSVVSPLETPFQSLHEVYFSFSHPCVTPYPMEAEIPLGMLLTLEQHTLRTRLNVRALWNNHVGYYIGLFGNYIKNYFLFNKIF